MKIQILIDNTSSWMIPFAKTLCDELNDNNHSTTLIHKHENVIEGDILFLLSCEKKFIFLHLNKYNLVVHESDLPKGKGMSPFTWQILEGKNTVVVSLIEAKSEIDSGKVFGKYKINLSGTELVNEWRLLQANATVRLIKKFIDDFPNVIGAEQIGESTYYRKRNAKDSELDINKSIKEQFNLLRVVDNERYPAWFQINGESYIIKIEKNEKN